MTAYSFSRLWRKTLGVLAALALLLAMFAVATTPTNAETEDEGNTLTVAISQEVDSFSPFRAIRVITTTLGRVQYDFLTNYDPDTAETVPALAEEWEHSEDGLTWTYHLRESTWSDGEPVTADDVVFTFTKMMEDEAAAYANGGLVEGFESVTAVDDRTVEIALSQPSASMEALDIPIAPEHIWQDVEDFESFNQDEEFPIVSNGPWILTGHEVNQAITLEANENYWRDRPGFDRLVFQTINDADAQVEALKAGEVDIVSGLTYPQFESLQSEENITVNQAQGKRFQAITINPGAEAQNGDPMGENHPALADPVVRQALVHTINREAIYEGPYGGYGEPNAGLIPSIFETFHWEPTEEEAFAFDIDTANQLLDDAGYTMGDDGIRVDPESGEPLSFVFNVHADNPQYVEMAGQMNEWAAQAGMELRVEPVAEVGDLLDAGTYDILTTGWSTNPDPQYIMGINLCSGLPATGQDSLGLSDAWYCNPEYDDLYVQQGQTLEVDARAELVHQMQKILHDDNVFVVLGYSDLLEAYRNDTIEEGSIQTQPSETGIIYGQDGYWSWWSAQPVGGTSEGGSNTATILGITGGAVVVLIAAAWLIMRRRGATAGDRE